MAHLTAEFLPPVLQTNWHRLLSQSPDLNPADLDTTGEVTQHTDGRPYVPLLIDRSFSPNSSVQIQVGRTEAERLGPEPE